MPDELLNVVSVMMGIDELNMLLDGLKAVSKRYN